MSRCSLESHPSQSHKNVRPFSGAFEARPAIDPALRQHREALARDPAVDASRVQSEETRSILRPQRLGPRGTVSYRPILCPQTAAYSHSCTPSRSRNAHSPTRTTRNSILKLAGAFHWPNSSRILFWAFSYSIGEPC